jgi:hypothetical protein
MDERDRVAQPLDAATSIPSTSLLRRPASAAIRTLPDAACRAATIGRTPGAD